MAKRQANIACLTLALLGIQFSTADDQSRIFVYAQWDTPPKSWTPISCDNEKIAEIKQGFFFAINLSAGRHVLSLKDGVPLPIDVRPGAEVFTTVYRNREGNQSSIPFLNIVPEETAKKEMRFLTYIEERRIHSADVSKKDPRPPAAPQLITRQPHQ